MSEFDKVTPAWIRAQMKDKDITQAKLAAGVNVKEPQISRWLSGDRSPSGAAQAAAIYYFFQIIS